MTAKIFKTYKEQRDLLQSRGLIIKHPRSFNNIMQRDDYYNIINGYKKYFIATTSPETYIPETTFEQLYALYTFDQEISSIFCIGYRQFYTESTTCGICVLRFLLCGCCSIPEFPEP